MKKLNKMKYYLFLTFILFVSCQHKMNKMESIRILYYNGLFESIMPVKCDAILVATMICDTLDYENLTIDCFGIIDTTITEKALLRRIQVELAKNKPSTKENIDARMKCYFVFEDGKRDSLCLSEDAIYGRYNDTPLKFSNEFAYLIRKSCGFYKWVIADQMIYFDELNDSTFVREKVISKRGEEY